MAIEGKYGTSPKGNHKQTHLGGGADNGVNEGKDQSVKLKTFMSGDNGMGDNLFGSSEVLNKVASDCNEIFKSFTQNNNIIVPQALLLDRESSSVAYSSIIMYTKVQNKTYVYLNVIDSEGRSKGPLEIINENDECLRMNKKMIPFTPDRFLDAYYMNAVAKKLNIEYSTMVVCTYTIIRGEANTIDTRILTNLGYQVLRNKSIINSGKMKDINIVEEGAVSNISYNITVEPVDDIVDVFDQPVRADCLVNCTASTNNNGKAFDHSPNETNRTEVISRVGVAYNLTPVRDIDQHNQEKLRLLPQATITNFDLKYKTLGSALLNIANCTVCRGADTYLGILASYSGDLKDIGCLNPILRAIPSGTEFPALNFFDKKYSVNDRIKFLGDFISSSAKNGIPLGIDITLGSPDYPITSEFLKASSDLDAAKKIIKTCVRLCDGHFNPNYDPKKIFANTGITTPAGKFHTNKKGAIDLRSADLAFIAKSIKGEKRGEEVALSYIRAKLSRGNVDNYMENIRVANNLFGTSTPCKIESTTVTLLLHADFLAELTNGLKRCNYNFTYKSQYTVNVNYNYGSANDYYGGAMGVPNSMNTSNNNFNTASSGFGSITGLL